VRRASKDDGQPEAVVKKETGGPKAARLTTVPSMKRRYVAAPVRVMTAEALYDLLAPKADPKTSWQTGGFASAVASSRRHR
jgi:hypothetical protein